MAYWVMKSEPEVYSWPQLVQDKGTSWNGVRNYQANNNMKAMKRGDEAFFYHSGDDKAIIGITKIVKPWYLDPTDDTGRFGMVDIVPVRALPQAVTLGALKADASLKQMAFIRQGRLSVSPVTQQEWEKVLKFK
ncbi:MAG: EVE domain-containing protein [Pseudomonadota bacterium]|nr:EVE domain-containing protein [Pseudomonadota bacterium]